MSPEAVKSSHENLQDNLDFFQEIAGTETEMSPNAIILNIRSGSVAKLTLLSLFLNPEKADLVAKKMKKDSLEDVKFSEFHEWFVHNYENGNGRLGEATPILGEINLNGQQIILRGKVSKGESPSNESALAEAFNKVLYPYHEDGETTGTHIEIELALDTVVRVLFNDKMVNHGKAMSPEEKRRLANENKLKGWLADFVKENVVDGDTIESITSVAIHNGFLGQNSLSTGHRENHILVSDYDNIYDYLMDRWPQMDPLRACGGVLQVLQVEDGYSDPEAYEQAGWDLPPTQKEFMTKLLNYGAEVGMPFLLIYAMAVDEHKKIARKKSLDEVNRTYRNGLPSRPSHDHQLVADAFNAW